jgi:hypothetical protein
MNERYPQANPEEQLMHEQVETVVFAAELIVYTAFQWLCSKSEIPIKMASYDGQDFREQVPAFKQQRLINEARWQADM